MAARLRDYRREYQRRIERGKQKGLSRSAARGHPKVGEKPKQAASEKLIDPNSREELALRMIRQGSSIKEASARYRIGRERLAAYLKENTTASFEKGEWKVVDKRTRSFPFYSNGDLVVPMMSLDQASLASQYMNTVKEFLSTGESRLLVRFRGRGIRDVTGRFYGFEVDENTLYELDHRGEVVIPEQYRISERIAS